MTRKLFNILFVIFPILIFSQEKISKDENGKLITESEFQKKWRDPNLDLYRWDYMENKKRICVLKKGQVQLVDLEYESTIKSLEKKLDTVFAKNAIVVLDFWYFKDICSERRDDNWSSSELREIKDFNEERLSESRKRIRKANQELYVFYVFGRNSVVKKGKSDFFKSFVEDSDDFFREKYFKEQAMCGSFLIVTPSGSLLYNGEASVATLVNNYIN
jgi:hypothetical protein